MLVFAANQIGWFHYQGAATARQPLLPTLCVACKSFNERGLWRHKPSQNTTRSSLKYSGCLGFVYSLSKMCVRGDRFSPKRVCTLAYRPIQRMIVGRPPCRCLSHARENTVKIGATEIIDTFAEAFRMRFTRLVVTAVNEYWLETAVREVTGYGTSVIGCDAEIAAEVPIAASETPDGRPGFAVLAFSFAVESLAAAMVSRTGQCLMTCPTTAVFDGLPESADRIDLGKNLRYFGDGYQKSKLVADRRYWRIPVMDGEFVVEESLGTGKGVAGGNILILAANQSQGLDAARRAVDVVHDLPGVITPFPGGVVRSGSKVGSRYKKLIASTSHAFCPTLRRRVETELPDGANCVYEIVIDGVGESAVADAMRSAMHAAAGAGVIAISAGNYGGKLGKFHFSLRDLLK